MACETGAEQSSVVKSPVVPALRYATLSDFRSFRPYFMKIFIRCFFIFFSFSTLLHEYCLFLFSVLCLYVRGMVNSFLNHLILLKVLVIIVFK